MKIQNYVSFTQYEKKLPQNYEEFEEEFYNIIMSGEFVTEDSLKSIEHRLNHYFEELYACNIVGALVECVVRHSYVHRYNFEEAYDIAYRKSRCPNCTSLHNSAKKQFELTYTDIKTDESFRSEIIPYHDKHDVLEVYLYIPGKINEELHTLEKVWLI